LDKTLWDFERNSVEALEELYSSYKLCNYDIESKDKFIKIYKIINDNCWDLYRRKKISRDELRVSRFTKTLNYFKIKNDALGKILSESYFDLSSNKINLKENCIQTLDYLFPHYQMHIITNGFEEVQQKKIKNSGLNGYFKNILTSENIGSAKPENLIFKMALLKADAKFDESLMIGDDWRADIEGAKKNYIDQVYFNTSDSDRTRNATYRINNLIELKKIL
jgi:putative hydrolase of the HAD superfamily